MKRQLHGLGVALVTPFFEDGSVDYGSLMKLTEYLSDGGVDYLVVMGTTGETPTLEVEEKIQVLNAVKEANKKGLPIVLGIGGNCTDKLIREVSETDLTGIDAILSVTPYYNKPSQRGIYEHYKALAQSTECDIILYNVPGRTGVNMLPETTIRLANEFENIIAIKEASGKIEQTTELIAKRPEHFMVISGDDSLALETIKRGGDGLISVAGNAFPQYFSQLIHRQFHGEYDTTERMWQTIAPIVKMLFEEGNPSGIKAALSIKGLCQNRLRLPLVPISDDLYGRMKASIEMDNF